MNEIQGAILAIGPEQTHKVVIVLANQFSMIDGNDEAAVKAKLAQYRQVGRKADSVEFFSRHIEVQIISRQQTRRLAEEIYYTVAGMLYLTGEVPDSRPTLEVMSHEEWMGLRAAAA